MTQERQQESGKVYRIACDQWYVVQPPIWEDNWRRARNWLAKVEATPDAPGGFTREWCERGRGRFKYSVAALIEGDLLEFGADYITWSGDRIPERWYGEVVRARETELHVRYFDSVEEMFATVYDRDVRTVEATSG